MKPINGRFFSQFSFRRRAPPLPASCCKRLLTRVPRCRCRPHFEDAARRLHGRRPLPGHLHPRLGSTLHSLESFNTTPRRVPVLRCFSRLRPLTRHQSLHSHLVLQPQHRSFSPDHFSLKPLTAPYPALPPKSPVCSVHVRTRATHNGLELVLKTCVPCEPDTVLAELPVSCWRRNVELSSPVQRGRLYHRAESACARDRTISRKVWLAGWASLHRCSDEMLL
jgi:hypothetical protein